MAREREGLLCRIVSPGSSLFLAGDDFRGNHLRVPCCEQKLSAGRQAQVPTVPPLMHEPTPGGTVQPQQVVAELTSRCMRENLMEEELAAIERAPFGTDFPLACSVPAGGFQGS